MNTRICCGRDIESLGACSRQCRTVMPPPKVDTIETPGQSRLLEENCGNLCDYVSHDTTSSIQMRDRMNDSYDGKHTVPSLVGRSSVITNPLIHIDFRNQFESGSKNDLTLHS